MKLEDILTLAKMGFTKDEILSIAGNTTETPKTETPKTEVETPKADSAKTDTKTEPDFAAVMKSMADRMEAMENRMKLNNIIGTSINAQPAESTEDILAKIINPNGK